MRTFVTSAIPDGTQGPQRAMIQQTLTWVAAASLQCRKQHMTTALKHNRDAALANMPGAPESQACLLAAA